MTSQVFTPFVLPVDLTGRSHDPYFASVQLLLHGIGSNGGSTITDSSSFARTATVNGATTSTAQAKFGASSIFGGNGNRFSFALGSGGSMTGDFTIEMFYRDGGSNVLWFSEQDYPTTYNYFYNNTNSGWQTQGTALMNGYTSVANGAWHFLAISRVGSSMRLFVDGVLSQTVTNSSTINLQTLSFGRYRPNNNLYWLGYWAEIRVTQAVGRYVSTCPVPSTAFPDF